MTETRKQTAFSLIWISFSTALSQLFSLIQFVILARILVPEKYGQIAAALAICGLTGIFVEWGINVWLLRAGVESEDKANLAGTAFTLKLCFSFIWGVGLFFLAPVLRPNFYIYSTLGPAILATILDALISVGFILFFITNRYGTSSLVMVIARALRLLGMWLIAKVIPDNAPAILWSRVVLDLFVLIYVYRKANIQIPHISFNQLKSSFKDILPYGFSDIINVLFNQVDLNLIALFTANVALIAQYSVSLNVISAIFMVILSVQNVLLPKLSNASHFETNEALRKYYLPMTILLLLVGLLSFIGLHYYGAKLITVLFGSRYAEAGNYLKMLSPILLVRSLALSLTLTLISKNLHARRLIPQLIALVFKVLAGSLVLSGLGLIDYPAILILSECVLVIGLFVIVRKYVLNKHATL